MGNSVALVCWKYNTIRRESECWKPEAAKDYLKEKNTQIRHVSTKLNKLF